MTILLIILFIYIICGIATVYWVNDRELDLTSTDIVIIFCVWWAVLITELFLWLKHR